MTKLCQSVFVGIASILCLVSEGRSEDWPGWGGSNRDFTTNPGVLRPDQPFELKVSWRKALGSGYSAVSVVGDVAVTMYSDDTFDYVSAFNANDGTELWRFKIDTTFAGRFGSANGPISTPLLTDEKVIALSAHGRLFALDLRSGELFWDTDLVADHQGILPFYGFTTSPLVHNDVLLVETGGGTNNAISGLDPGTGQVLWTASSDTVEYQSPFLFDSENGPQFIGITDRALYGLQPTTGKVLWRFVHGGGPNPMGAASANLVPIGRNRFFFKNTARGGIFLTIEYANEMHQVQEVANTKDIKGTYIVPVHHNGLLFGYNSRIFTCVDVETGERVWRSREPGDGLPIVVDGHLVVVTKDGKLSVAPATAEGYNEVASLNLFDSLVWAPASFANGKLYLRSMTEIAAVEFVHADTKVLAAEATTGKVPGSSFARFVEKVEKAVDKKTLVDEFMAKQEAFPVIEGDEVVHFVYRGAATDMALVGDLVGWRYDQPMHRVEGTDLFYYSAQLEPDTRLTYKFTKDLQVPVVDSLNTRKIRSMFFGPASWFSMPKWTPPSHLETSASTKSGRIDSLQFKSTITDTTRLLEIYLPPGYDEGQASYPVAYLHDARAARALGEVTMSLDNLIGSRISPVIVVFLPAFFDGGYNEYIGDQRDIYAKTLVEEIVPLIDRTYRTHANAENRANIGHLLAAYMALYSTFKHPDLFGKLSVQSIWWDGREQQREQALLTTSKHKGLQIYFDWGKYDLTSPLENVNVVESSRIVARLLQKGGYTFAGGEVNDGTGWESWKNRTDLVFETLFPVSDTDGR